MTFEDFARLGYLKSFTVRLPVTTIAKIRLLQRRYRDSWPSTQVLMFDLIEDSIERWLIDEKARELRADLDREAHRAMQLHGSSSDSDGSEAA